MGGLGGLIQQARLRLGWTQQDLADRVNVDRAYISQIERNQRKWPLILVPDLAEALGLSQVDMAIAAGLIEPDATASPSPATDPRDRQIAEELARLDDGEKAQVLSLIRFLGERRTAGASVRKVG